MLKKSKDALLPRPVNHVAIYKVDDDGRRKTPYLDAEGLPEGMIIFLGRELTPDEDLILRKHAELHQDLVIEDGHTGDVGELTEEAATSLRQFEELLVRLREEGVIKPRKS